MRRPVFFVMVNVPDQDWSYRITDVGQTIGRSAKALIRIPVQYGRVSRRHATVWREKTGIWLQDEGSKFGTLVNGVFLKSGQPANITVGDRIGIANVELSVVGQLSKLAELTIEAGIRGRLVDRNGNGTMTASVHFQAHDFARFALEQLSPAELEIVLWMYRGFTNDAELGEKLCRSPHTIRTQIASIYAKLDVHTRADIVTWLKRCRTLQSDEEPIHELATRSTTRASPRQRNRSRSR